MKYFLLLFAIAFFACSKNDKKELDVKSGFIIDIKTNSSLSTGQIISNPSSIGVIHVWKADSKNFEISSSSDAIQGYAFDKISQTSIKSDYTSFSSHFTSQVLPGKYFVYVTLDGSEDYGKFAYSFTTFEVAKGEIATLTKTFTTKRVSLSFEDWNATE